jgi:hypothetical protein
VDHQGGDAPGRTASPVDAPVAALSAETTGEAEAEPAPSAGRRERVGTAIARLVHVIRTGDDKAVEQAVLELSRRRRWLAPLGLIVGAFVMLFQGLKLLFTNWRLTLVQIVPAMWIWLALLDLKIHTLHGKEFHVLSGLVLIPCVLAVTALTAASFYLNAVFAFAISVPGRPQIRPAFGQARRHLRVILAWGCAVGLALSWSALIVARWSHWRFVVAQSIVVGVMMLCYLAVPARLVGIKQSRSRRDKLAATMVGGAVGAVVCSPPYMLGRLGILMLGWGDVVFWFGIVFIAVGAALQTGATSAVKAVKMSAKLVGAPATVPTASSE